MDVIPESHYGWSWNDPHDPDSQSDKDNLVETARDSGWRWFLGAIDHKDQVVANHDSYFNKISKQIDDAFQPHRDLMQTWKTFLDGFHELLPPSEPPSPQACPMQGGSAVPQGTWLEGADVKYASMAVSQKGPSPLSDWSDSFKIGKTAFATLTRLGPAPTADSLEIYRQIRPHGGQWSDPIVVANLQNPFPVSYNDTFVPSDW